MTVNGCADARTTVITGSDNGGSVENAQAAVAHKSPRLSG